MLDDEHGPRNREVQATFLRLLEHHQKRDRFVVNPYRPREVDSIAENNPMTINDHDGIRET